MAAAAAETVSIYLIARPLCGAVFPLAFDHVDVILVRDRHSFDILFHTKSYTDPVTAAKIVSLVNDVLGVDSCLVELRQIHFRVLIPSLAGGTLYGAELVLEQPLEVCYPSRPPALVGPLL